MLDKNRYSREAFLCEIAAPSDTEYVNKKFDVAFVLDESGSISYGNFSTKKNQCSTLVEKFVEEDRVAVFTFDDTIRMISSFTDIESAKDILCSLEQHNGNTAVYDAINEAVNEFVEASNEETTKIMVLLTDGYNNSSRVTLETAIQNALDNNVVIYCIGIGSVNTSELSSISSRTGGIYYGLNSFSQLESAFNRLILETDLYKDSDNDGLSDYHEKKIASGEMCTGTGGSLKSCSTMNYLCDDSDGDGLSDGEEVEIRENTQGNYCCFLYSNPCLTDTDTDLDEFDDFLEDYIGTSPFSGHNELAVGGGLQEDTVKEKGYVYEPKTKPVDWGFFNVIAGATIIAITIGEDVVTLGAGIADDAASFAFGFSLIFGY